MGLYYDRDGKELGSTGWAKRASDPNYINVRRTKFKSGWVIQTVWDGSQLYASSGPLRLIFKTVLFHTDDPSARRVLEQYPEEAYAEGGHQNWVQKFKFATLLRKREAEDA